MRLRRRYLAAFRRVPAPAHQVIKPVTPADRWFVYFVYSPEGSLSAAHRFTLARLRDMNERVFVVVASKAPEAIDQDLRSSADALYWKALSGYDFSAYALALRAVAAQSPHASALVLNDSVYGPFVDLRPFIERSPWDLLGFTASSHTENHIQSYAFMLRDVTARRVQALAEVLPADFAYAINVDVIDAQELQLARIASQTMSVGACWYGVHPAVPDPMLTLPQQLLAAGSPFIKRSVVGGKHYRVFQPHAQEALRELLAGAGHPV